MAALHSERNIRAKIQEYERQFNIDEISTPTPQPRNATRPSLAPKPCVAPRASVSTEEETNTHTGPENNYVEVIGTDSTPAAPTPAPRPLIKPPPRPSVRRTRAPNPQEQDAIFNTPPFPPRSDQSGQRNGTNHCGAKENEYVDAPVSHVPSNTSRGAVSRKPTIIRVPSKQGQEASDSFSSALPVQRATGGPPPSIRHKDWIGSASDPVPPPRPGGGKVLPHRPPAPKPAPGRSPGSRRDSVQRNSTLQSQHSNRLKPNPWTKMPVIPPRPNPGHQLYNKYTLEIPHGIAEYNYNGMHTGELSFQKNEVLVLLNQMDSQTFRCQVGDATGKVQKSYMKIITPLWSSSSYDPVPALQENTSHPASAGNGTLQVQALYDFNPEGPGELWLKAGDIINNVEQIDSEWYLGTSNGLTGFFPINYVKILSRLSASATPQNISGPRCVAKFDFEGEHSDELSFSEGQVIHLVEHVGEDWARGEIGGHVGMFPLNFVDVLEDLPSSAKNQTRVPLLGTMASNNMQAAVTTHHQACAVERVRALYDFTAQTGGDLTFRRGDVIQVIEHVDEGWSHGRLNGREGCSHTPLRENKHGSVGTFPRDPLLRINTSLTPDDGDAV